MTQCTSRAFRGYLDLIEAKAQEILDEIAEFRANLDEIEGKTGENGLCPYYEELCKIAEHLFCTVPK